MKVLVLGLNPSRRLGKSPTLKVLYKWLDVLDLETVSFCNIFHGYDKFSLKDIEHAYVREISKSYGKIITLGAKTGHVLDLMGICHFNLPHPSGLNRQLNNLKFVEDRLEACKTYLRES